MALETLTITRGTIAAAQVVDEAVLTGGSAYPDETVFLATDLRGFPARLVEYLGEGRPVVLVSPGGDQLFIKPANRLGRALARLALR